MSAPINAIETRYAGHRFRSRLEARWAVFFDHLDIRWEYEPQGFVVGGRPYLPDFLLPDCGTWIEVKGRDEDLDCGFLTLAAEQLPYIEPVRACGPRLLILGPHPEPRHDGDWGWIGISPWSHPEYGDGLLDSWYGFGMYDVNSRPYELRETSTGTPVADGSGSWLTPAFDQSTDACPGAYTAARSARFEHGERGR